MAFSSEEKPDIQNESLEFLKERPVIRDEHLEFCGEVGRGSFGRVFKAYHKERFENVAVKVLDTNVSHIVFKEAKILEQASCKYVLDLIGIYEGKPPLKVKGIVTEYMERGSIETLQEKLPGPPPEPLAFQFVYQTALAMNYLHLQGIVHLDLKPSNILLSDMLDVKVADFGLSRESMTLAGRTNEATTRRYGTLSYIPPEAHDAFLTEQKYKLVRSFDIYSFGILIWSIFTGRPPYLEERCNDVPSHICDGERPGWETNQAELLDRGTDGIEELVDLMRKCWDQNPENRPSFKEILERHGKDDKSLFLRHSSKARKAVSTVLDELDSLNDAQQSDLQPLNPHPGAAIVSGHTSVMEVDPVSGHTSVMEVDQVPAGGDSSNSKPRLDKDAERHDVVDRPLNINVTQVPAGGDSDPPYRVTKTHPSETVLKEVYVMFNEKVTGPVLDQLLDRLLQQNFLSQEEVDTMSGQRRYNKAKEVIDTVKRKGSETAEFFLDKICELDPRSDLTQKIRDLRDGSSQ